MNTASRAEAHSSFLTSGSLWGGLAGALLGIGVAVGVSAGAIMFPLIILGSAAMGVAFGNAVGGILSGDNKPCKPSSSSRSRNFTGGDLEQSHELIDHLRLRENEHKMQIEKDASHMQGARTQRPGLATAGAPAGAASTHFQNMLKDQPVGKIER